MGAHLDRAQEYLSQGRPDLAEGELRRELVSDPGNGRLHALLALCLVDRDDFDRAVPLARKSILLAPEDPLSHYSLAYALFQRERADEALAAAAPLLKLAPNNPDFLALLGQIHRQLGQAAEADRAAERGLEIDPNHQGCKNLRSIVKAKLDAAARLGVTGAAVSRPLNPPQMVSGGLELVNAGRYDEAMKFFVEARRLDPHLETARRGIVDCFRGHNALYRTALDFAGAASRGRGGIQLATPVIGLMFLLLIELGALQWLIPASYNWLLLAGYVAAAWLLWMGDALFCLLMVCSRLGRRVVTRDQALALKLVVPGLVFPAASFAAGWLLPDSWIYFWLSLSLGLVLFELWAAFEISAGIRRALMLAFAATLGLLSLALFASALAVHLAYPAHTAALVYIARWALIAFIPLGVLSPVLATILAAMNPRPPR
ncbi:MAG: tetratricopeptide repeat protein [Planctomycetia bacterium]|nr:tetratricopeptide repeat protein [Planctomycetia bacterium]